MPTGIRVVKEQREVRVANLWLGVDEVRTLLLGRLVPRLVLVKGRGADLVLRARVTDLRVRADRGKRGVPIHARLEALPPGKRLTRTGNPVRVRKVAHVGREPRAVRVMVKACLPVVRRVRHAAAGQASQVVGVLRRVPATAAQTALQNHAQPPAVMIGSQKVRQRTSRDSALQSLREAIVRLNRRCDATVHLRSSHF